MDKHHKMPIPKFWKDLYVLLGVFFGVCENKLI